MTVAIVAAFSLEIRELHNALDLRDLKPFPGLPIVSGLLDDRPVLIGLLGTGPRAAAAATEALLDAARPSGVIGCGVAGSLVGSEGIGQTVVASDLLLEQYGTRPTARLPRGLLAWKARPIQPIDGPIAADPLWADAAEGAVADGAVADEAQPIRE